MPREANPCNKTVDREHAHEVWESPHGWVWYVLRKYQSPSNEEKNPYAKWLCCVVSPFTSERGDYGDVYVREIKAVARKIANPLVVRSSDQEQSA